MATLVRSRSANPFLAHEDDATGLDIGGNVPAPFPVAEARVHRDFAQELLDDLENDSLRHETILDGAVEQTVVEDSAAIPASDNQRDMILSMSQVKHSCLLTLNNLLATTTQDDWMPIVPTRRHSMPSPSYAESSTRAAQCDHSTDLASLSALQTLVSNLRSRDRVDSMIEITTSTDESVLVHELRRRVEGQLSGLDVRDAELARALVSALGHLARLSQISGNDDTSLHNAPVASSSFAAVDVPLTGGDVYDALRRQVSDFQSRRVDQQRTEPERTRPVLAVETSLLWSQIDADLDSVLRLSRERHDSITSASSIPPRSWSPLPPQYEHPIDDDLPEYTYDEDASSVRTAARKQSLAYASPLSAADEKVKMDLEAVTLAIDRLYKVAPQLHNQRVELKTAKLEQMERARLAGPSVSNATPSAKQKGKMRDDGEPDVRDLEKLFDMIGRASTRKYTDQVVVLDDHMRMRMDRSRQNNMAKRDAFVEQLVQHSSAGRLHSQDAVLTTPRVKAPEALLTLPEFIREPVPASVVAQDVNDPETLLTLPEFVRETAPPDTSSTTPSPDDLHHAVKTHVPPAVRSFRRLHRTVSRSRSLSAPPLAWLKPSGAKTSQVVIPPPLPTANAGLAVTYIAEYQDTLKTLYAFLRVDGVDADMKLEAEVIGSGSSSNGSSNGLERLLLKCGLKSSRPLRLPVHVMTGQQVVRPQSGGHYEINLPVSAERPAPLQAAPLLDTTQIQGLAPTSFACTSCSLPLVQTNRVNRWNDLPSEHWAELLDAWMCHHDQRLTDQAGRATRGFWPAAGQALVGGSYMLFDQSSVVANNVRAETSVISQYDDWRLVRCLCGAVIGRCQQSQAVRVSPFEDNAQSTYSITYRLAKYSLRPVVPSNEIIRIPLSAYVIQDMHELAQAHAIWRFILVDEEEERPRLLLWMLKPHMLISYEAPKHYLIQQSGTLHVAKILFKLIGPTIPAPDIKSLVEQHPHFAQHERLLYPFHVCQRLAALLTESNGTYPGPLQELLGLRVGWLQRA